VPPPHIEDFRPDHPGHLLCLLRDPDKKKKSSLT
jgi:hypothetical protein